MLMTNIHHFLFYQCKRWKINCKHQFHYVCSINKITVGGGGGVIKKVTAAIHYCLICQSAEKGQVLTHKKNLFLWDWGYQWLSLLVLKNGYDNSIVWWKQYGLSKTYTDNVDKHCSNFVVVPMRTKISRNKLNLHSDT